jgi:LmbE family N-acetylglucosaminyl deacetylase
LLRVSEKPMQILALGPHPDDIEFGCAAILIKEIRRGNRVKLLVFSRGEGGTAGTPEIREHEARAAAKAMGAEIEFVDFGGDCRMEYTLANRLRIAAEIRKTKPSIVLAPHTAENQHPDHVVVAKLARDAARLARYGGVEELKPAPTHRIDNLFFYNITQHMGRVPDVVIDISDVAQQWEAVMRCHATQTAQKSYLDLQMTAARLLGVTIGVEYAMGLFLNDPVRVEYMSDITLSSRSF